MLYLWFVPNLDHNLHANVEPIDGRSARREKNRRAVVEALLQCYDDGMLKPSVADIAERSGVSHRSVFRYFDDMDELSRAAIALGHERYDPMSRIHEIGNGPLDVRIERIVEQRITLFKAMEGPARAVRIVAPLSPVVMSDLIRWRLFLRAQLRRQFAAELRVVPSVEAQQLISALDVLCSFETWMLMRDDHNLTQDQMKLNMAFSLRRMLQPCSIPDTGTAL